LSGLILLPIAWLLLDRPVQKQVIVKKQEPAADKWQVISNHSDTFSKIILQDQSVVKLYAHSELRIKETPDPYRRDVFLQGTAYFTVTKDTTRPFTVYTSSVATTALGTAFTIKADIGDREVLVKLHEGKVVVRRVDTTLAGLQKDIYLLPGDQLLVSATGKVSLEHLSKKRKTTSIKKNSPVHIDALSFNNTPLADVLGRLSQKFKIEIRYDAEELKAIFITASFTDRDSLPQILDIICVLNNLRLQNSDGVFAVSR
jgi:transmembrane sensor